MANNSCGFRTSFSVTWNLAHGPRTTIIEQKATKETEPFTKTFREKTLLPRRPAVQQLQFRRGDAPAPGQKYLLILDANLLGSFSR